jgi:hypothetical protein
MIALLGSMQGKKKNLIKITGNGVLYTKERGSGSGTGRQPPPLSSVLYGIIYKRCSVVAAQVLLREKSGA